MNLLIVGGTGSLGNALVDYLLEKDLFDKIIIFSRDEMKQHLMDIKYKSDKLRFRIGDCRDKNRLKIAMKDVSHVIHCAALKIVPLAEMNPSECIKTNIVGSQNVIEAAFESGNNPSVVAISTDKACKPINMYGSSKLAMEKLFIAANNMYIGPKYGVVRYGNVSGSNGSVIPLFKEQIKTQGFITLTSEHMSRFWISLDEAAKFVVDSMKNINTNIVVVPDFMPSYWVIDLALCFTTLNNIKKIGIRPGEKLHEDITDNLSSDKNKKWLYIPELKEKLQKMGVI